LGQVLKLSELRTCGWFYEQKIVSRTHSKEITRNAQHSHFLMNSPSDSKK
jgi:hypothetical protein